MKKYLRNFRSDEDGAVTVDWVVLTAAIVVLGLLVVGIVGRSAVVLSERISEQLEAQTIN